MKERIRELSQGQVEYIKPEIVLSPEEILVYTSWSGIYRGEVFLASENETPVKAVIYSSNPRVRVVSPSFYGKKGRFLYEVSVYGLQEQDTVEGFFTLVTNGGERKIPYLFVLTENGEPVEKQPLSTLRDFYQYRLQNPEGALRLFMSKGFPTLPFMEEPALQIMFRHLKSNGDGHLSLEEFLVGSKAKQPLHFKLEKEGEVFSDVSEDKRQTLSLKADGLGYGFFYVYATADWIHPEVKVLAAEANPAVPLKVFFRVENPHGLSGQQKGEIHLVNPRQELVFGITVKGRTSGQEDNTCNGADSDVPCGTTAGMQAFLTYLQAKMKNDPDEIRRNLSQLQNVSQSLCSGEQPTGQACLLRIYGAMENQEIEKADHWIDTIRESVMQERLSNVLYYCSYLYLRAVFNRSEGQMLTASKLIMKYYQEGTQDPMLYLLYLQADSTMQANRSLMLAKLKELYQGGCHSPFLYLMAVGCLREDATLLRTLDDFEVQCLHYGVRYGILDEAVAEQVGKLSRGQKRFRPLLYRTLCQLFEQVPRMGLLEGIVMLCIRGDKREEKYFPWYALAVENHLAITGLQECYLAALPDHFSSPIPREVLLYFTMSPLREDGLQERLYENLFLYYEKDAALFQEFLPAMEEYAISKLLQGRISRRLVPLYQHMLYGEMIDQRLARVLPGLLLAFELQMPNDLIRIVTVRCPDLIYEDRYPLENGRCCVPLYTEDTVLLFTDAYGKTFTGATYKKETLFHQPDLLEKCEEVYPAHVIFMLRHARKSMDSPIGNREELEYALKILQTAELENRFKHRVTARVIDYYYQEENEEQAAAFLLSLDLDVLSVSDRIKSIETMIRRGYIWEAYERFKRYPNLPIQDERLREMTEGLLKEEKGAEEKDELLDLCYRLFQNHQAGDAILAYLARYYNGPTETMQALLQVCREKHLEAADLPERLLAQQIFSGNYTGLEENFAYYREYSQVRDMMLQAYYVLQCHRYFVEGHEIEEGIFRFLREPLSRENHSYSKMDICNVAMLYYLTTLPNFHYEDMELGECLLKRLCAREYFFAFYQKLWQRVIFPPVLNGRMVLEHRSRKADAVYLRFRLLGQEKWEEMPMKEMFSGIFTCTRMLFADETLQYSIVEVQNGERVVQEKEELITGEEAFVVKNSTFDRINRLCILAVTGDYKTLEQGVEEYETRKGLGEKLFTLRSY